MWWFGVVLWWFSAVRWLTETLQLSAATPGLLQNPTRWSCSRVKAAASLPGSGLAHLVQVLFLEVSSHVLRQTEPRKANSSFQRSSRVNDPVQQKVLVCSAEPELWPVSHWAVLLSVSLLFHLTRVMKCYPMTPEGKLPFNPTGVIQSQKPCWFSMVLRAKL